MTNVYRRISTDQAGAIQANGRSHRPGILTDKRLRADVGRQTSSVHNAGLNPIEATVKTCRLYITYPYQR